MCSHRSYTTHTRCFTGPVSSAENPAAHGNVTDTDTCSACGAQRRTNVNGSHIEEGQWGHSTAEQLDYACRRLRSTARPAPVTIRRGGVECVVSVDADGYLCADDESAIRAAPAEFLAEALAYRLAVIAVQSLAIAPSAPAFPAENCAVPW